MSEESKAGPLREAAHELPLDKLTQEIRNLGQALAERMVLSLTDKVEGMTGRLTDYIENGGATGLIGALTGSGGPGGADGDGDSPGLLKGAVKGAIGGLGRAALERVGQAVGLGRSSKGGKVRITNIYERLDMGAPLRVVYNQWTRFEDFPNFMKKVENVEQEADEKVRWKAQIFLSHRTWSSTIIEQVPDKRIIWRSQGAKGYVDGAVTFHEIDDNGTRVALVLEYHPQGGFEHIGNLWRAQGRRARLEFKHFGRHVMTQVMLHPDEIQGWRGTIHEGKVVKDHETALREEQAAEGAEEEYEEPEGPEAEAEEYEEEEAEEPERAEAEEEYEEPEGPEAEAEEPEEEEAEEPERAEAEEYEEEEAEQPEEAEAEERRARPRTYERPEPQEPPVRRRRAAREDERPAHPRRAGARRL